MHTQLQRLAALATLALAGCGGGGGSATPSNIALTDLQGFWNGPVSGADFGGAAYARAVALEDGRSWVFLHATEDGALVGLATAQLAPAGPSTFTASGKRYGATGAVAADVALSGTQVTAGLSITNTASGATTTLALSADNRYRTAAVQADVAGTWTFTQAGGSQVGTWAVANDGTLTGTRTPGCTYTGTVRPHGATAVYDVALTESCGGATKALSGVAKLNTAKTVLTFGLTTSDGTQGIALAATKAPS